MLTEEQKRIAYIIRTNTANPDCLDREGVVLAFIDYFKTKNSRFDEQRFKEKAGLA